MKLKIYFANSQNSVRVTLKMKLLVRRAIENTLYFDDFHRDAEVSVTFTDDSGIRRLNEKFRYVINPGAVGKPRDNNPHASFGIWDTAQNLFRFIREPYDLAPTQAKMAERKFPSFLIDSLALGL